MRYFLSIFIIVLFIGNYQICNIFYPDNIDKWWGLKQNIYNVIIALAFIIAKLNIKKKDKKLKFILDIGVGLCVSNCIDRIFFNINSFQLSDIVMIILTILTSYYKNIYVRQGR